MTGKTYFMCTCMLIAFFVAVIYWFTADPLENLQENQDLEYAKYQEFL